MAFRKYGRPTREEQDRRILDLWLERPRSERTGDDLLKFFGWLSEHEPDLIPPGAGTYEQLRAVLGKHVVEKK